MNIKDLKCEVEAHTNRKIVLELDKKYEAFDEETYEKVATYDPSKGTLEYTANAVKSKCLDINEVLEGLFEDVGIEKFLPEKELKEAYNKSENMTRYTGNRKDLIHLGLI